MLYIYIFSIIINKFYYRNKVCQIVLFLININLEVNFYCGILSFNLAINL